MPSSRLNFLDIKREVEMGWRLYSLFDWLKGVKSPWSRRIERGERGELLGLVGLALQREGEVFSFRWVALRVGELRGCGGV